MKITNGLITISKRRNEMQSVWTKLTEKAVTVKCPCCDKEVKYWDLYRIQLHNFPCLIEICKECISDFNMTHPDNEITEHDKKYTVTKNKYLLLFDFVSRV